jgi:hypothetical protein
LTGSLARISAANTARSNSLVGSARAGCLWLEVPKTRRALVADAAIARFHVQVEVIAVSLIGLRPKDRSEHGARTTVHAAQECGLGLPGGGLGFLQSLF